MFWLNILGCCRNPEEKEVGEGKQEEEVEEEKVVVIKYLWRS